MPSAWTDVSSLHNWVLGEPLLDWLERFGSERGYVPETAAEDYVPEADYGLFIREKAKAFESAVLKLLSQTIDIAQVGGARSNDDAFYAQTLRLMQEKREAIYQGLVRDPEWKVFGVPDLLIRGSALQRLVPGALGEDDPDAYYVLDIKFKGLELNKKGDVSSKHGWERIQLALYERGLADMVGRAPCRSFIMGRRLSGAAGRGGGCLDALGWVKPLDEKGQANVQAGLQWLADLEAHGADWTLDPPSDPRLLPKMQNEQDGSWHAVKKALAGESPAEPSSGPAVSPARIEANRHLWHRKPPLEFYVDFETLNAMNDDFSRLPLAGGRPMIFMIGCGHEKDGEFRFEVWTAQAETYAEEERIIQAWMDHMKGLQQPGTDQPPVIHWYRHEVNELSAAATRHDHPEWTQIRWFDLLKEVMQAEPVGLAGVDSFSLKPVTRKLHDLGLIETVWEEGPVEGGLEAMTAAWACYRAAQEAGVPVDQIRAANGTPLMPAIEAYNMVDCKAMWEILRYLRANH